MFDAIAEVGWGTQQNVTYRTARGLQYSGPVITHRVQYGRQIQYNTTKCHDSVGSAGCSRVRGFTLFTKSDLKREPCRFSNASIGKSLLPEQDNADTCVNTCPWASVVEQTSIWQYRCQKCKKCLPTIGMLTMMTLHLTGLDNMGYRTRLGTTLIYIYIILYLPPVLNPMSYDGARVSEASGRPIIYIYKRRKGS